jgi:Cupin domain
VALWTVERDAVTAEHVHEFDEWLLVVEGSYVLTLNGKEVRVRVGQEYFIPKGTTIAGRVTAGTRTIHAFGGRRAERAPSAQEVSRRESSRQYPMRSCSSDATPEKENLALSKLGGPMKPFA